MQSVSHSVTQSDSWQHHGLQPTKRLFHGNFQARILEWVAIPSPGDLPNPMIEHRPPALQADSSLSELPGKPNFSTK